MKIYIVGGWVRDKILGYPSTDKDWVVVGGSPAELLALGYEQVGASFPVFLHPKTKEEYALARSEKKAGSGYHGFEVDSRPTVTLEEDLLRRDLTINAMAFDPDSERIIDPYGGQDDLKARMLRHVSPAFVDDPLRVIRLARFAAYFPDFKIAPETIQLAKDLVKTGELITLSKERITQEIIKTYHHAREPLKFWIVLSDLGALDQLLPGWAINDEIENKLLKSAPSLTAEQRLILTLSIWQKNHPIALDKYLALPSLWLRQIKCLERLWEQQQQLSPAGFIEEALHLTRALHEPTFLSTLWPMIVNPPLTLEKILVLVHDLKSHDLSWIQSVEPASSRSSALRSFYQQSIEDFLGNKD